MKIETIENIRRHSDVGPATAIQQALQKLKSLRPTYKSYIRDNITSGYLERQIAMTEKDAASRQRTTPGNRLSNAAGAYFLNEDVIGGSRVPDILAATDSRDNWDKGKLKLGPGISFIEPPKLYQALLQIGEKNQELLINYNAPFGTASTRRGIKSIMDTKIDPEGDFFPDTGVYLTQGATEGIDLFMEMLARVNPNSRVVFLGLSYYTGPYSAVQKGLNIDRIVGSNIDITQKTQFFPKVEEIKTKLPEDVGAIVLTMPNNPNGEIYSDGEIENLLQVVKDRDLLVLFDCIFEDMYLDNDKNSKSRFLQIAVKMGVLGNIVVVDSLSKTQNLPGARIGFLATTDDRLSEILEDVVIGRRCNPQLTAEPLVLFEGLARKLLSLKTRYPNTGISTLIEELFQNEDYPFGKAAFQKMYDEWNEWNTSIREFYRVNLEIVEALLEKTKVMGAGSPNDAAFNTFIKLSAVPEGTNANDFFAKLMFTLATYTQSNACFGLPQDVWDKYLGLWVRISYASSRDELAEGLIRLIIFTQEYAEMDLGNSNKYPTLAIKYNDQI